MSSYFPRQTVAWKTLEEPPAFRRLTLSLVEMGLLTGIALRLYRSLVLTHGPNSFLYLGATIAVGAIFLFGMTTLHLGNFTVRRWLWRAPAFALLELVGEMIASLALIALHREPWGTARAEFHDWLPMATVLIRWRFLPIVTFALILAGVVQLVRYTLLRVEHKDHLLATEEERQLEGQS
jgi:hypothetical protein